MFSLIFVVCGLDASGANAAPRRYKASTSTSELGSESRGSILDQIQLSALTGPGFLGGSPVGTFAFKGSWRVDQEMPLYYEQTLGVTFNTDVAAFPILFGARYDLDISDTPRLKPFAHFALGPAFQTKGSTAVFSMFTGPGAMFRLTRTYDVRLDMGMVLLSDNVGFQVLAGFSL
jgi:hypothetical protein